MAVPIAVSLRQRGALKDALEQLGLLKELELGPEPEWSYLGRFIIATNGDVQAAVQQIRDHQEFMATRQLGQAYLWDAEKLVGEKAALSMNEAYPMFIRGKDRYGHPVLYAQVGHLNAKQILKLVSADGFLAFHCWLRQRMMWMRDMMCAEENVDYDNTAENSIPAQYTVILDLKGCSMSQLGPSFYHLVQRTLHVDQIFYAERMFRTIVINMPFVFHTGWRVVKGFMDPDTIAKLRFSRSGYQKHLEELIDPAEIPQNYGGSGAPLCADDFVSNVTERFFASRGLLDTTRTPAGQHSSKDIGDPSQRSESFSAAADHPEEDASEAYPTKSRSLSRSIKRVSKRLSRSRLSVKSYSKGG